MRIGFFRIAAAAAVGGVLVTGAHVGIGSDHGPTPAEVHGAVDAAGPGTRSADFARARGRADRSVYVQHTASHGRVAPMLCVWDASPDGSDRMGGCNPESDPLAGHLASVSFAAEGGPPPTHAVGDARVFGVAAPRVAALSLTMSDGSSRAIALPARLTNGYRAFAFRESDEDLAAGIVPVEVVATNAAGAVIDTIPTGFPQQ